LVPLSGFYVGRTFTIDSAWSRALKFSKKCLI
jgi:hypothetical protein